MIRASLTLVAGAAVALTASACGSDTSPTSSSTTTAAGPTTATVRTAATPSATPPITGVTVVATGAAAGPTGTVVFVAVNNTTPSATGAVQISVLAKSSNGKPDVTGTAAIPNVAVGEAQAVAVPLNVPSGDTLGTLTATAHTTGTAAYANPVATTGARFINDAITPSISVTVLASAPVASATIVAVCWKGTTVVGGGSKLHVSLAAGSQTVSLPAELTTVPASCTGYARPG